MVFEDVFLALANPDAFRTVPVAAEAGAAVWPNSADLDPDILYAKVTGVPVELRLASAHTS